MTGEQPAAPAGLGRVHFVGMGGVGMSGLARILLARGLPVSGSDSRDGAVLADLRARGAVAHVGHHAAHVADADTVVVSTAIREGNPELAAARERGLRVLHRSEVLAALMAGRRGVAVAGTHGKTTTTSMVVVALRHGGADPSFAIGGEVTGWPAEVASAHEGTGEAFVAEADESDASFLRYRPEIAVVTNVEPDHLDHYGTAEAVRDAFTAFTGRITPGGLLVAGADDPGSADLAERTRTARPDIGVVTYGEDGSADVRLTRVGTADGGATAQVIAGALPALPALPALDLPLRLRVPGRHNLANATAALVVGARLGVDPGRLAEGLATFGGARRRFELVGRAGGAEIRDDYAHHPTEVEAALRAARAVAPSRVVVLFQPHLYSRTRMFADDFGRALSLADEVLVLDVYGAREDPQPGVTGELITRAVTLPPAAVEFVPRLADAPAALRRRVRPGDLVLTMGAGDVTTVGPLLLRLLSGPDGTPA